MLANMVSLLNVEQGNSLKKREKKIAERTGNKGFEQEY